MLDAARVRETILPLLVLTGGITAMGVFGAYQLDRAAGATVNSSGALQLAARVTVGALAVLAESGGEPLLRRVTANPTQTAD
ncbi:hypothetical protein ACWD26_13965 [Streptomyces sp. NPDC002787]